jgi:hypothetical protein
MANTTIVHIIVKATTAKPREPLSMLHDMETHAVEAWTLLLLLLLPGAC